LNHGKGRFYFLIFTPATHIGTRVSEKVLGKTS
jgi:hypothetical protein